MIGFTLSLAYVIYQTFYGRDISASVILSAEYLRWWYVFAGGISLVIFFVGWIAAIASNKPKLGSKFIVNGIVQSIRAVFLTCGAYLVSQCTNLGDDRAILGLVVIASVLLLFKVKIEWDEKEQSKTPNLDKLLQS